MADSVTQLTGIPAFADRHVVYRNRLLSRLYVRAPFFGVLAGKAGDAGQLRAGAYGLIGGDAIPRARKKSLMGGYENKIFFQTGKSSGTKNMAVRDTVPEVTTPTTASQDQQRKSASFRWTKKITEVLVWNTTLELGQGQFALGDAKMEAQNIGMQHHFDHFIKESWVGEPADQSTDIWSEQGGVDVVCDDNNVYGQVDRNIAGGAGFRGLRDATALSASLDLVEKYHVELVGSYTESVQDVHEGFDTVLWNRDVWAGIKAEAKAAGINTQRNSSDLPDYAKAGILREGFFYNDTFHTWDPWLKNYNTGGSSGEPDLSDAVLFTKAGDWCFYTHPDAAFKIGKWHDIGEYVPAGNDAHRTLIKTIYQWWNERPWGSVLATAIT